MILAATMRPGGAMLPVASMVRLHRTAGHAVRRLQPRIVPMDGVISLSHSLTTIRAILVAGIAIHAFVSSLITGTGSPSGLTYSVQWKQSAVSYLF
jgi:hypothetical protein